MNQNHYVEDWLSAVAESNRTEGKYIENIVAFAEFARERGQDFYSIVDVWRKVKASSINEREEFLDVWMDLVRSFHTQLKRKYAPLVIKNFLATTKSFLKFWDIPVRVRLPRHACVIYHNRDITKEELRQILTFASPRDRVIWLVMAESGMRVSTAINMRYGQIREDVEADKIPMRIMLPSASLKDHVGDRWSFIGEDGVRELKEYLRRRLPLDDDELVFASEKPGKVVGDQFSVSSLSIKFSRIVKKLGLAKPRGADQKKPKSVRQHCLRKYFRNNIRVEQAYRKFWEGRGLGSDEHYISRDVEKHRRKYREGYPYLRIYDIEPMIRREDIESIVEARVKERLAQRKEEQTQEIQTLKRDLEKIEPLVQWARGFETEKEMQQFLSDMQNAATVITKSKTGKEESYISTEFPVDLLNEIRQISAKKGMGVTEFTVRAVKEMMEKDLKKTKDQNQSSS